MGDGRGQRSIACFCPWSHKASTRLSDSTATTLIPVLHAWSCNKPSLLNREAQLIVVTVAVQSLSHVQLFVTPWITAHQAPLSSNISQSLLKLMSTESMMLSNHLILCHSLLFCFQSFPASGSFPMSWLLHQVAKLSGFQLQHRSFQ